MKKIILSVAVLSVMLATAGIVTAKKNNVIQNSDNIQLSKKQNKKFELPEKATEVSAGVFYLGEAKEGNKIVEGYAFLVKKTKNFGKPGAYCGNDVCESGENINKCPSDCGTDSSEPDTRSCYEFLAKGTKWKSAEDYMIDPTNLSGLEQIYIGDSLHLGIYNWEEAVAGYDIIGNQVVGDVDGADTSRPDGKNEVMFGDISSANAIGVTIVWGVFKGPLSARELVEWDMIFDDVDYIWGMGEADKMDLRNIAIHEIGHAVGMGDLYNDFCSEQTMYGYSIEGETKKIDLADGDIVGIRKLYGLSFP